MNKLTVLILGICLISSLSILFARTCKTVAIGQQAPTFELKDERGNIVKLADFSGKVALAFFPSARSISFGCKTQMCSLRNAYDELQEQGITMFGITNSSASTIQEFARTNRLPFRLLHADTKLLKQYGAYRFFVPKRYTFLINNGIIVDIIYKVDKQNHAQQIMDRFKAVAH